MVPHLDLRARHPACEAYGSGYVLSRDQLHWFADQYVSDQAEKLDPRASPLLAESLAELPPALVITAGYDPLRDEGAEYVGRLRDAGVDVQHTCYEGAIHTFFQQSAVADIGAAALDEAAAAAGAALGGRATTAPVQE